MKQKKQLFNNRLKYIAWSILGLIALAMLVLNPLAGAAISLAIVIPAGVNLSDAEKLMVEGFATELKKIDDKYSKGYITEAKFDELITEKLADFIKTNQVDGKKIHDLEEALKQQGLEIVAIKKGGGNHEEKTIETLYKENKDKIIEAFKNKQSFEFHVKTEVTRALVGNSTQAYRIPDIGQIATRGTILRSIFNVISLPADHAGVIRYIDQTTKTNNAAARAESSAYPESAIAWTEYTLNLQKIADSIPVTEESLNDVSFIRGEIDQLLNVNIATKEDIDLYTGDGNAPNIKGIYTYVTAFNSGTYAGVKPLNANLYDLCTILKEQISNGKERKYMPNFVLMNPADINKMILHKNEFGDYVIPPFVTIGADQRMTINGMTVVASASVTANTLVVGDGRYAKLYDAEGYNMQIGYIASDFLQDVVTMKARKRLALLIRNADLDGFLKVADIDTTLRAITTNLNS